jgi:hypothetical protein
MSVNEFIKNMAAAGFTGSFKASNGEQSYRGSIEVGGKISTIKVQTVAESRDKINRMLHGNQANKA